MSYYLDKIVLETLVGEFVTSEQRHTSYFCIFRFKTPKYK